MALAFRHKLELSLLAIFIIFAFASYEEYSVTWMQWTTLVLFIGLTFIFDIAFTDESSFVFDPDADNWRRKTEKRS